MLPTPLSLFARFDRWLRNAQGRARLSRLPEAALKDIGLSRADAWAEIQKPFWRN